MIPEGLRHLGRLRLASRSPQRRAILTMLGIDFDVVPPDYDEPELPGEPAGRSPSPTPRAKAASVEGDRVLGVDTIVVVDGRVLGKPAGEEQAARVPEPALGTHPRGALRPVPALRRRRARAQRRHRRHLRAACAERPRIGTSRRASGATAPGATRCRGWGRRSCDRIAGDYTNVVGLPVPALIDAMAAAAIR